RGPGGARPAFRPRRPTDRALERHRDPRGRARPTVARRSRRLARMPNLGAVRRGRPHVLRRRGAERRAQRVETAARLHRGLVPRSVIEAVIFDLDGVILDSEELWDEVREGLARERGGRWSAQAQADMMGMSSTEWSRYLQEVVGLPESPEEINREVVDRMLARYAEHLPLIEG